MLSRFVAVLALIATACQAVDDYIVFRTNKTSTSPTQEQDGLQLNIQMHVDDFESSDEWQELFLCTTCAFTWVFMDVDDSSLTPTMMYFKEDAVDQIPVYFKSTTVGFYNMSTPKYPAVLHNYTMTIGLIPKQYQTLEYFNEI